MGILRRGAEGLVVSENERERGGIPKGDSGISEAN